LSLCFELLGCHVPKWFECFKAITGVTSDYQSNRDEYGYFMALVEGNEVALV